MRRLACPVCRRDISVPDEGFPVCYITEYLRDQVNQPSDESSNKSMCARSGWHFATQPSLLPPSIFSVGVPNFAQLNVLSE